ncbi:MULTISPECIES: thiamine ABC transporter ATP-binding protein [unclassified Shinella]|uniref:thiamine ABC transporter ATP-binding protein n=1 Tax=unclassified Shinella TaxID=2643062 RepID=UPI00234ED645|nr:MULTISPECIES: thiamine ABC transporter ATP-binding protein [unclassified Shinella]MCO5154943.1 thiamine ABC transporter ATP-binding protein [Shinella sp.]MDC7263845.1 thiamine ABC transporter ATP-binding protein [Shinella sp. HY16]MDC7270741.1 thiamine ABC transporter ATP-binding protein [Shinella sp. YZ44]
MPDLAIHLTDVAVHFGEKRLSFDCAIPAGAAVAVVGPSGAGKSTLFNVIAGFQAPASGDVRLLGETMAERDPAERPVSIIFQDNNLFAHLTVADNVGLGIDPALRLDAAARESVFAALARVGLGGYEQRLPGSLSGGERQRVALARALVRRRPILLLDEPFAALDPAMRAEMAKLLTELRNETKSTMLFITHQPEDIRRLADRVMFLEAGTILLQEPVVDFLSRREPPAVAKFLGHSAL